MSAVDAGEDACAVLDGDGSDLAKVSADDPIRVGLLIGFGLYFPLILLAGWAAVHLLPDQISLALFGYSFVGGDLHHRLISRGVLLALILPAIFAIELAIVGWAKSSLHQLLVRRTPSSKTDLANFLLWQTPLMSLAMTVMSLGVALISGVWLHDRLAEATGFSLSPAGLPVPAQVLIYFLLYSFLDYWGHRLDHTAWFWPLHRYHHAADEFCVLTAVRSHPAVFTGVISAALPIAIFRPTPQVVADTALFVVGLRYVIHSRIESDFGWIGRYVLQSPAHHRRHHTLNTDEAAGHFGIVPLWDHLFGTWRGGDIRTPAIGVETPYRHGGWIGPDWWRDYGDFWRAVTRSFRRAG